MTGNAERREAALDDAAAWVVRLQSDDLLPHEGLAFDAWLAGSPAHAAAYDAALEAWFAVDRHAPAIRQALALPARKPTIVRRALFGAGLAAAAVIAMVILSPGLTQTSVQSFSTGKGEQRTVRLADGSRIDLNASTRLSVRMARDERRATLDTGEAVFDVASDATRPFYVDAGERMVRVVGTQFDVRRRAGILSVTVARGAVEVRPTRPDAGPTFRLHPGQRLDHQDGAAVALVSAVTPQEVFAWRSGRLIYRDRPLSEVVADLNEHFSRPVTLQDGGLGALKVSGVLMLDDQDAVIRRLALSVPITAVASDTGVSLRRREVAER